MILCMLIERNAVPMLLRQGVEAENTPSDDMKMQTLLRRVQCSMLHRTGVEAETSNKKQTNNTQQQESKTNRGKNNKRNSTAICITKATTKNQSGTVDSREKTQRAETEHAR